MNALTIKKPDVAIKLTSEQAKQFGLLENIKGEMTTIGPWSICTGYKALCVSKVYSGFPTTVEEITIYGQRSLQKIKQGGYELEGYVSVKGEKRSAFTSSQLFEIDGETIDVATIHARAK